MSILASHLRAILFSNLRNDMDGVLKRKAAALFNSIDSDLDITSYSLDADPPGISSSTQEALEDLEEYLKTFEKISEDTEDDEFPIDTAQEANDDLIDEVVPNNLAQGGP